MNEITQKWKPILDVYEYTGNKLDNIAFYMENHIYLESLMFEKKYCMPVAMKILIGIENLNLENLTFNTTEKGVTEHNITIYLDIDEEITNEMSSIEKTLFLETKLIQNAIEKINNEIEKLNSKNSEIIFETNLLVGGIDVNMETNRPFMRMKLNYNLKAKQPL